MVVSATINKYSYITARQLPPFFEYKHRIRYFEQEQAMELDQIRHPSVRESAKFLNFQGGLEVVHNADLPARSGLGSSSSFTVGMLQALRALQGYMPTKRELARDAIHVEQNMIGENVGSQDQVAAAFGGLNLIRFGGSEDFAVEPITISASRLEELSSSLLLIFTGFARTASEVAEEQVANISSNVAALTAISRIAQDGLDLLTNPTRPITQIGELLDEQWSHKKTLGSGVTTGAVEDIYDRGKRAGAIGGKLLGAGGGGFILFCAAPDKQPAILEALGEKMAVPFRFENSGSSVVYFSHG